MAEPHHHLCSFKPMKKIFVLSQVRRFLDIKTSNTSNPVYYFCPTLCTIKANNVWPCQWQLKVSQWLHHFIPTFSMCSITALKKKSICGMRPARWVFWLTSLRFNGIDVSCPFQLCLDIYGAIIPILPHIHALIHVSVDANRVDADWHTLTVRVLLNSNFGWAS